MVTEAELWDRLRTVTDPEYPLSLVDMGMIYDVSVHGRTAEITMTFTSIGCPAMDMIASDITEAMQALAGIDQVEIDVVWSPPWTKHSITPAGRRVLEAHGVVN